MKILHVTPAYYPATRYGGPIFSTFGMCNALANVDEVKLRVFTSDMAGPQLYERTAYERNPSPYSAGYDVWFSKRRFRLGGIDVAPSMATQVFGHVQWADVVWLTGAYSFPTIPTLLACRLLRKPLLWSPRGALQASFEWSEVRRRTMKKAFEGLCQILAPERTVLHVTSDVERNASSVLMPRLKAEVVSNGIDLPPQPKSRRWKPDGTLRLMFISRIDPKKGLEALIKALPLIEEPFTLSIYGEGEEKYVADLRDEVCRLGLTNRVVFCGHVDGASKAQAFHDADIFVFPTHSENFGMVVAEALAYGVPAIVSRGAPWAGLEAHGAGLWVDRDPSALASAINSLANVDLAEMGARGRAWMHNDFTWESKAAELLTVFRSLQQASSI